MLSWEANGKKIDMNYSLELWLCWYSDIVEALWVRSKQEKVDSKLIPEICFSSSKETSPQSKFYLLSNLVVKLVLAIDSVLRSFIIFNLRNLKLTWNKLQNKWGSQVKNEYYKLTTFLNFYSFGIVKYKTYIMYCECALFVYIVCRYLKWSLSLNKTNLK